MDNVEEMERFLEKFNLSRLDQEETEIIKIQAESNEKEMIETILKINKTKSWLFEKIN